MVGQSNAPRLNGEDEGRILNCEANLRTSYTHIDQNVNMRSHLDSNSNFKKYSFWTGLS